MSLLKENSISPYISVAAGTTASDAIKWYEKVFGAKVEFTMPMEGSDKILHATLNANGNKWMISDHFEEWSGEANTKSVCTTALCLTTNTPEDVDALIEKAKAEGAKVSMEPGDQFWGDRYGGIVDPFGNKWTFNSPISEERKKVAEDKWEETKKQMAAGKRGADEGGAAAAENGDAKKAREE